MELSRIIKFYWFIVIGNNTTTKIKLVVRKGNSVSSSTDVADVELFDKTKDTKSIIEEVECTSLDKEIEKHNITTIDLLKTNCEGGEYDMIYSSEKIKTGIVKNIVGSFHDFPFARKMNPHDLLEYCQKYVTGDIHVNLHE